jgi:hypothetical protein
MRGLLEKVPTFVVTHKQVGLLGAKVVCRRLLRQEGFTLKGELSHFSESSPRGIDVLRTAGRDIEAVVDPAGTGSVVMRRVRKEESPEETDATGATSTKAAVRRPRKAVQTYESPTSDLVLIRAAVVGGLIASLATLLLHTTLQRYLPTPSKK